LAGEQPFAAQEVAYLARVEVQDRRGEKLEAVGHVGDLHKAIAEDDAVEAVLQLLILDTASGRDLRNVLSLNREQHDVLVQHLVVFQVM
jgi:hypothetical protein